MVDFRYHLVSIIAIFLALALGIVVGTTALNGALLDNLKGSIGALTTEKRDLEGTVGDLRSRVASDEQLAERIGPAAVSGQLTGHRVVLVTAPNAPAALADGLTSLLQDAGAVVTGTVQLRPDLVDPARAADVDAVVGKAVPAGLDLTGTAPVQRAAQELAAALLTPSGSGEVSDGGAAAVLSAFRQSDLVDAPADLDQRADLAVLVAGDPVVSSDPAVPAARARALLSFASAFDSGSAGAVVVGPLTATTDGGVLQALRDDGAMSERVSSVDGVDRAPGRVAAVFALREQVDGRSGRYGTGPGTSGAVPSLPAR